MKAKRHLILLFSVLALALPGPILAALEFDIGLTNKDVWFSKSEFFAGEKVKIYAQVHNYGSKDISAYVIFYQGQTTIGEPQPVSVVSGGTDDAVWVDWLAIAGQYDILVRLVGQSPADDVTDNNSITIPVNIDNDHDNDSIGDSQDTDDDNDGLSDIDEVKLKTDSLNPDSDGDSSIDGEDDYPLDKNRSVKADPKPTAVKSQPVSQKTATDNQTETTKDDQGVPYFKFAGEQNANSAESQEATAPLPDSQAAGAQAGGQMLDFLWAIPFLILGFLIYFSPRIFRRKRRRPIRRSIKK
ncbi:MAG: hypothetical protein V1692_00040 [bacterium]